MLTSSHPFPTADKVIELNVLVFQFADYSGKAHTKSNYFSQ